MRFGHQLRADVKLTSRLLMIRADDTIRTFLSILPVSKGETMSKPPKTTEHKGGYSERQSLIEKRREKQMKNNEIIGMIKGINPSTFEKDKKFWEKQPCFDVTIADCTEKCSQCFEEWLEHEYDGSRRLESIQKWLKARENIVVYIEFRTDSFSGSSELKPRKDRWMYTDADKDIYFFIGDETLVRITPQCCFSDANMMRIYWQGGYMILSENSIE